MELFYQMWRVQKPCGSIEFARAKRGKDEEEVKLHGKLFSNLDLLFIVVGQSIDNWVGEK